MKDFSGRLKQMLITVWQANRRWIIMIFSTFTVIVMGYAGFYQYFIQHNLPTRFLSLLYVTLQLFMMESGAVEGPPPLLLELARYAAPLIPLWALIEILIHLFKNQIKMLRFGSSRSHTIVCGLNDESIYLIKNLAARGVRVVAVDTNPADDIIQLCKKSNVFLISGNPAEEHVLERARAFCARHIVVFKSEDDENLQIALSAYQTSKKHCALSPEATRCLVHVKDMTLFDLFRNHRIFGAISSVFEIQMFNIFETAARRLFLTHPLDREHISEQSPLRPHLILIGFGAMGQSIALYAAKIGHFANGKKLKISALDRNIEKTHRDFLNEYPAITNICDIEFRDDNEHYSKNLDLIRSWTMDESTITSVVLTLDEDWQDMKCALRNLQHLRDLNVPIFMRISKDTQLMSLTESETMQTNLMARVFAFGKLEDICSSRAILDEPLDSVARIIHNKYVEQRRSEGAELDSSLAPWELLHPVKKESNRLQADHIGIKLRAVGRIKANEPLPKAISPFTDGEVEALARMEHDRWCAERFLAGWRFGQVRDENNKISPYLAGWDNLEERIKEYDRQAVRQIPELLRYLHSASQ